MPEPSLTQIVALVAFAGTYLGLAAGRLPFFRVDRTGVAIIGAAIVMVAGVIPWDQAVAAVDVHTLALLFGMMIVTAYLRLSGFIVVEAAREARIEVRFFEYCRVGVPLTLATLLVGWLVLSLSPPP